MNQVSVPSMSNIFTNQPGTSATSIGVDQSFATRSAILRRGVSRTEGPLHNDRGFLYDLQQGISNQSLGASVFGSGHSYVMETHTDPYVPTELTAADMSLSTLYLHELHHRQVSILINFHDAINSCEYNITKNIASNFDKIYKK